MSESAAGRLLPRTWMLSKHRHDPRKLGNHVMHVRETPPHALSHAHDETDERMEQQGRAQHELDKLTAEERAVLELQAKRWMIEQECEVENDHVQQLLDEGWCFVRHHEGKVVLKGDFPMHMTYEDIGQRLGLSARQVHRRVVSAHRKLRSRR